MIETASITMAPDGGILISVFRSGMSPLAETVVVARGGRLVLSQGGVAYVNAPLADMTLAAVIAGTDDLTVVEVDDAGFDVHERVRRG